MKIMIVRHGEPDYENNTLTKNGFLEVEALGKYLKDIEIKAAYTSPLNRAKYTAEATMKYHNKEAIVLPWLEEFIHYVKMGKKKVLNWEFLPSYFEKQKAFYNNDKYLNHSLLKSGKIKKYYLEVINKFDELLESHGYKRKNKNYEVVKANKDTIIIFCHFGTMSVLLSHLLNIPYLVLAQSFICLPSGITTLVSEEREKGIAEFRLMQYGELTHLELEKLPKSFKGRFCEIYDSDERH